MTTRQPSASLADRDASRSHGSIMTERDEGTDSQRLARSLEHQRAGFRGAVRRQITPNTADARIADNLSPLRVPIAGYVTRRKRRSVRVEVPVRDANMRCAFCVTYRHLCDASGA